MNASPTKTLLRGMFTDGGTIQNTTPNMMRLIEAVETGNFRFPNPSEHALYEWSVAFFRENGGAPSLANLLHSVDKLPNEHDIMWGEVAEDLKKIPLATYATFSGVLATEVEAYRKARAKKILVDAQDIVGTGLKLEDRGPRLVGPEDAFRYVVERLGPLTETTAKPSRSDVWAEGEEVVEEYKAAKLRKPGLMSGLGPIDTCFSGIRNGELWTHAGFTGGLKTTLALNFAYTATQLVNAGVFYVSLEMPAEQLRRLSYALHSANPKFGRAGLNYSDIKEGRLVPAEEEHLVRVAGDARSAPGSLVVWSPAVTPTVAQIGSQAELIDRERPIGLIVLDHSGLVKPSSRDRDFYVRMNSVFLDAKRLAMGFAKGRGVPVLVLHQLNREGAKAAEKGRAVSLYHLANTNEAERSSDYITYSWVDQELRGQNRVQIGCLKNREGALFEPFQASVNFPSRRVSHQEPSDEFLVEELDWTRTV